MNRLPFAAANFHPLGFSAGLADGVADVAVASLIARLADGVALVAPTRLCAGNADGVAFIAIAGLIARDADRAALVAPARLSARPADGVAFVAIAGVMHGLGAADRHLLADLVIDRLAANFFATIPHDLLNRFVAGGAALTGLAHVAASCARGRWTAVVTAGPAIAGLSGLSGRDNQAKQQRRQPGLAFHRIDSSDSNLCLTPWTPLSPVSLRRNSTIGYLPLQTVPKLGRT